MIRKGISLLFLILLFQIQGIACTIVAVSGRITDDGRPLLLKNRDSDNYNIYLKIAKGNRYVYFCQCVVPNGNALSGYNEVGFSIINSHSFNMPNTDSEWNSLIMQMALEKCATVEEFEFLLDSLPKPMPVSSNYGVMDAQGNVAIYETNAYGYTKYDANATDCGYLIRTNYSQSEDTLGMYQAHPAGIHRYRIASAYLEDVVMTSGFLSKEHLFDMTRCLVNSDGMDLRDIAPFDENSALPVDFRFYIPRYNTTSAMVIQGVLPNEASVMTVAWTMLGPPYASVTVPYLITPCYALPQKAELGIEGCSWFCNRAQQLKNSCFIDNTTLDLAQLYNMSETGIMQKISNIEEEILDRGYSIIDKMRKGEAHCYDIELYYYWLDNYIDEQYEQYNLLEMNPNATINEVENRGEDIEYYDILGRRIKNVKSDAIIKYQGKIGIVLKN